MVTARNILVCCLSVVSCSSGVKMSSLVLQSVTTDSPLTGPLCPPQNLHTLYLCSIRFEAVLVAGSINVLMGCQLCCLEQISLFQKLCLFLSFRNDVIFPDGGEIEASCNSTFLL